MIQDRQISSSRRRFGCCNRDFMYVWKVKFCKPFWCFKVFGTVERLPALFCIGAVPSVLYIIASIWIPNTPFYLLKQGNQKEAEFALKRLRQPNKASLFSLSVLNNFAGKLRLRRPFSGLQKCRGIISKSTTWDYFKIATQKICLFFYVSILNFFSEVVHFCRSQSQCHWF